jgi:hypothetical protein
VFYCQAMRAWWLVVLLVIFSLGVVVVTVAMITLIPGLVLLLDRLEGLSRRFAHKAAP